MGPPEIKYGESLGFLQHTNSGLWVTYAAPDPKALRLGLLKRKVGPGGSPKTPGGLWEGFGREFGGVLGGFESSKRY